MNPVPIRIVALETDLVKSFQQGAADANGQAPEQHVCSSNGRLPCRHCLTDIRPGEAYLILAHRPFPLRQPYAEQGPIFLHAHACARREETPDVPRMFLDRAHYLIRGYGADDRTVYGTGEIVAPHKIKQAAEAVFADTRVAYIHVRSAANNCYQCRIDRA
jgi:hypothetical protein